MPFDEKLKREVLEKCYYTCVWCQRSGAVELHHIVPEAAGGPSTVENACPLCPNCHTEMGGNPEMRKGLRQRRDWWIGKCSSRTQGLGDLETQRQIADIATKVDRQTREMVKLRDLLLADRKREIKAIEQATNLDELGAATALAFVGRGDVTLPPIQVRGEVVVSPRDSKESGAA